MKNIISVKGLTKKYKTFSLDSIDLDIPYGFSTALIGANGAGKTTLLDSMCGLAGATEGDITFFEKFSSPDIPEVRLRTGYCTAQMFPQYWTAGKTERMMKTAFENFSSERYRELCQEMQINIKGKENFMQMSDGTKMKLALAAVMARDTDLLVLDEPGSSLDPLMRDRLCGMFRKYLAEKDGQRSVIFSTHNISDMESVADYAVIMADGKIIEKGFTEDLKDKYRIVNGSAENAGRVKDYMISFTVNGTIYEGLALKENADVLENMDAAVEIPDLQQISVELLRSAEEV